MKTTKTKAAKVVRDAVEEIAAIDRALAAAADIAMLNRLGARAGATRRE